jgi:hypothetical protein
VWRRNVSVFDSMAAAADLPRAERLRAFHRIDADHALLSDDPHAVHAMDYHRRLEELDHARIQASLLMVLVQVDIARSEQRHWPTTLPADEARWLSLNASSDNVALLLPRETDFARHALLVSADGVTSPMHP